MRNIRGIVVCTVTKGLKLKDVKRNMVVSTQTMQWASTGVERSRPVIFKRSVRANGQIILPFLVRVKLEGYPKEFYQNFIESCVYMHLTIDNSNQIFYYDELSFHLLRAGDLNLILANSMTLSIHIVHKARFQGLMVVP